MESLNEAVEVLDKFKEPSVSMFWKDTVRAGLLRMEGIAEELRKSSVSNTDAWNHVKEAGEGTEFARGYAKLNALREQVRTLETELLNAARNAIAPQLPEAESTKLRDEFKAHGENLAAFNLMAERLVAPRLNAEKDAKVLEAFEFLSKNSPSLRGTSTGGAKATATNPDTPKIRKYAKEILGADLPDRGRVSEEYITKYYEAKEAGTLPEAYK